MKINSLDIIDIFGKTCLIDFSDHTVKFPFTPEQIELLMRYVVYGVDHGLDCGPDGSVEIALVIEDDKPLSYVDIKQFVSERGIHSINKLLSMINPKLSKLERAMNRFHKKQTKTEIQIKAKNPIMLRHLDRTQGNLDLIRDDLMDKYMSIPKEQLIKHYLTVHNDDRREQLWKNVELDKDSKEGLTKTEDALFKINETVASNASTANWQEKIEQANDISDFIAHASNLSCLDSSSNSGSGLDSDLSSSSSSNSSLELDLEQLEEDYLSESSDSLVSFSRHVSQYMKSQCQAEDNKILINADYDTICLAARYACDQLKDVPYTTDHTMSEKYSYYCITV